jgi:hypothetical protein
MEICLLGHVTATCFSKRIAGDTQGHCSVFRRIIMNQAIISKSCRLEAAQTGDKARGKMTFRSRAFGTAKTVILAHSQYPTESTHCHTTGLSFLNIVTVLEYKFRDMYLFHEDLSFWSRDRDVFFEVEKPGISKVWIFEAPFRFFFKASQPTWYLCKFSIPSVLNDAFEVK